MYRPFKHAPSHRAAGFTLVELVVGIVVMAIALTLLTATFFSSPGRAVEPMMQARAAEFGQGLMEEILAKRFDEATPDGGVPPCTSCTPPGSYGSEGESRATYDDVDDYHDYCGGRFSLEDIFGNAVDEFDTRFEMEICVTEAAPDNSKRIQVDIYPPGVGGLQAPITLVAYRGNY